MQRPSISKIAGSDKAATPIYESLLFGDFLWEADRTTSAELRRNIVSVPDDSLCILLDTIQEAKNRIEDELDEIQRKYVENRVNTPYVETTKRQARLRDLANHRQVVQTENGLRKKAKKDFNRNTKERSISEQFVEAAREILDPKLFRALLDEASKRVHDFAEKNPA